MLKIMGRTLVILAVMIVIAVGVYALVQSNPALIGAAGGRGRANEAGFQAFNRQESGNEEHGMRPGIAPGRTGRQHEGGERRGSWLGLLGVLRNIILFTLIALAVASFQTISTRIFQRRTARANR